MSNRTERKIRKAVAEARLIDDTFMSAVFQHLECTQVLIDHVIPEEGFVVRSVQTQLSLQNLHGRSVRLDIVALDRKGRYCNIEIQRGPEGASPKRARYNNAILGVYASNSGEEYDQLGDTYTVFLSEHDVLKTGLPLVHIDRVIRETGELFADGSHILYVDTANREDTPLGKLMADLYCREVESISNETLRKRVRYYKEGEGNAKMCELVKKAFGEELQMQKMATFAAAVEEGLSKELIMKIMDLSEEQFREFSEKIENK